MKPAIRLVQLAARMGVRHNSSYGGSANYVPGKQGYAPGFPPPKNFSDAPRAKLPPKLASDLPAPKLSYEDKMTAKSNAARQYREKLRALRYGYMHDHLEGQEVKREKRKESLAAAREVQRDRREKLRKEREEYETNVRDDPLSAANVLNADGLTLLGNVAAPVDSVSTKTEENSAAEGSADVGYRLAPPRVTISMPVAANAARANERQRNRSVAAQRRHSDNVQALMGLFHEAESFVHYGNLENKIYEVLNVLAVSQRTLAEMVEDLNKNGGIATSPETARRTNELRNTLQGTTGRVGRLGYDGLTQWVDSHPDQKDEN
ncbi:hypothetical protein GGI21_001165 [Coemansia aciculifera]|uniref:Uncharacterized protein n=1 Tax=Coemansia aciculifera TaxID=417176 RepID=A0ACC1M799_9FUNG|nr:hypothetical protein IWW38_001464 [Coemansia aciculifera]KAJ2910147.1 hypothetical protein GGI21_001165 [Coemansia aciculifera]